MSTIWIHLRTRWYDFNVFNSCRFCMISLFQGAGPAFCCTWEVCSRCLGRAGPGSWSTGRNHTDTASSFLHFKEFQRMHRNCKESQTSLVGPEEIGHGISHFLELGQEMILEQFVAEASTPNDLRTRDLLLLFRRELAERRWIWWATSAAWGDRPVPVAIGRSRLRKCSASEIHPDLASFRYLLIASPPNLQTFCFAGAKRANLKALFVFDVFVLPPTINPQFERIKYCCAQDSPDIFPRSPSRTDGEPLLHQTVLLEAELRKIQSNSISSSALEPFGAYSVKASLLLPFLNDLRRDVGWTMCT